MEVDLQPGDRRLGCEMGAIEPQDAGGPLALFPLADDQRLGPGGIPGESIPVDNC